MPRFIGSVTPLLAAGVLLAAGSAGAATKKAQILGFTSSQWYPGVPPQVKSGGRSRPAWTRRGSVRSP